MAYSDAMIEAGAKALYGDGWETKATPANKKYCKQKVRDILEAVNKVEKESVTPDHG